MNLEQYKGAYSWSDQIIKELEECRQRFALATVTLSEAVDELAHYATPRRDLTKGPLSEWNYIEIKHESDYEYYPNHVDKETIEEYREIILFLKSGINKDEK